TGCAEGGKKTARNKKAGQRREKTSLPGFFAFWGSFCSMWSRRQIQGGFVRGGNAAWGKNRGQSRNFWEGFEPKQKKEVHPFVKKHIKWALVFGCLLALAGCARTLVIGPQEGVAVLLRVTKDQTTVEIESPDSIEQITDGLNRPTYEQLELDSVGAGEG